MSFLFNLFKWLPCENGYLDKTDILITYYTSIICVALASSSLIKIHIFDYIVCYIPTPTTSSQNTMTKYIENYCWLYVFKSYHLFPYILLLQALILHIPTIILQNCFFIKLGSNKLINHIKKNHYNKLLIQFIIYILKKRN